eukprot:2807494-Amphidinium_carterae.4
MESDAFGKDLVAYERALCDGEEVEPSQVLNRFEVGVLHLVNANIRFESVLDLHMLVFKLVLMLSSGHIVGWFWGGYQSRAPWLHNSSLFMKFGKLGDLEAAAC